MMKKRYLIFVINIFCIIFFIGCASTSENHRSNKDVFTLDEAINQIVKKFKPTLRNKKVVIGSFIDHDLQTKLKLSDFLTDGISIAVKKTGGNVVVNKNIVENNKDTFIYGVSIADMMIIGNFFKLDKDLLLSVRLISIKDGKVIDGIRVAIEGNDIPNYLMDAIIETKKYRGTGKASISYQCLPEEKPCPPLIILEERAIVVAKMMAMQKVVQQSGVSFQMVQSVVNGRSAENEASSKSSKKIRNLSFSNPVLKNDSVVIDLIAEISE